MASIASFINKQNLLLYGGYAAFFLTCFVMFAYFTFPYDRVRDVLEAKVAEGGTPGQAKNKLSIGELGPHWLSGVALEQVVFERGAAGEEKPSRIEIDELTLRAQLLPLLLKNVNVDFGAEIGDGDIDGSYETENGAVSHVDADLDEVDLGRFGVGSYLGVPLAGLAAGTIDVAIGEKPAGTQGNVEMRIEKLKLGDGKTKIKIPGMPGGLTVETIDAGTLELKIVVKDGVATIEKMKSEGPDVELDGSGSIRISRPFPASRADITLAVKFTDKYKQRSDRTKAAFMLMADNPIIKRSTGPDGMMRFKLTGPIAALRSVPTGPARGPKSARAGRAKPSEPPSPEGAEP